MTTAINSSRILSPQALQELRETRPEALLLDVRTPREYESVHIRGSFSVPLDALPEHQEEIRANVVAPVVLVCQSGSRSLKAEKALSASGMANLFVLEGGVNRWLSEGLEVSRGPKRVSIERQVRIVAGLLAFLGGILAVTVHPLWGLLAAGVGGGLLFAGLTDTCAMGTLLSGLPFNRSPGCDIEATVRALKDGDAVRAP